VNEALKMQLVKDQLAVQGFPGKGSTPAELAEMTRAQLQSWGEAVKAARIQPD
jgi:tripartite-type tricarboxylate transporter receptor subunit TctC